MTGVFRKQYSLTVIEWSDEEDSADNNVENALECLQLTDASRPRLVHQESTITNEQLDELVCDLEDQNLARRVAVSKAVVVEKRSFPEVEYKQWKLSNRTIQFEKSELKALLKNLNAPEAILDTWEPCKTKSGATFPVLRRSRSFSLSEHALREKKPTSSVERVQVQVDAFLSLLRDRQAPEQILRQFLPKICFCLAVKKDMAVLNLLSIRGYNPLHCIAAESDFSHFEPYLTKHRGTIPLLSWISEKTEDDEQTPVHVMCLQQNVPMFRFFLESGNKDMKDLLVKSGMFKTKTTACNAFLCLAHSIKPKSEDSSLTMLNLLVELYGEKASAVFIRDSEDSQDRKFMGFVHQSEQQELIARVSELMSTPWV